MTIDLIVVGKTDSADVRSLIDLYLGRINHYAKFSIITIPDLREAKNMTAAQQCTREGEIILKQITPSDHVTLLDERGGQCRSVEFAAWLQKRMNSGLKRLVFVIGGPYGFSEEVRTRANSMLSLSPMTFSHQIVRAIFTEQLYRAFTILSGEPYHHE